MASSALLRSIALNILHRDGLCSTFLSRPLKCLKFLAFFCILFSEVLQDQNYMTTIVCPAASALFQSLQISTETGHFLPFCLCRSNISNTTYIQTCWFFWSIMRPKMRYGMVMSSSFCSALSYISKFNREVWMLSPLVSAAQISQMTQSYEICIVPCWKTKT